MHRIILLIVWFLAFPVAQLRASDIDAADPRIWYSGRWERSDRSEPWCAWQGSSIKARFNGTAIQADIEIGSRPEYIRVLVDGNSLQSRKLELTSGRKTHTLAYGLPAGDHQIEIVKETYSGEARMTFRGFTVAGAGLGKLADSPPRLRIEFYGDSNLAGHSLEHEKNKGGPALRGCYYSFAGIAARMLGAEYHNISCGGAIIAGRLNSVMSFYNRVDFYHAEPRWSFELFPADICVVNIGANDINAKSKEQIKKGYKALVSAIRKAHPKAHIVLMNGYGWARAEPANYTHEVVAEIKDDRLSCVTFPWLFNEWHGCEYDHAGMAQTLVDHLASVTAEWKQVRPIDVMDGFGRNGNAANGSFELVAPFGGYGWRYFTDGAQRINDPQDSPVGEWFLRLPEGKQVHQPNPASKDWRYTLKLKMRGQEGGGQARVRIEFRDQKWRHEIADSARDFMFQLGTAWEDYTVTVDSPEGAKPSDPSRDPWQIIVRLEALTGIVDVDDVRLSHSGRGDTSATPATHGNPG